MSLEPYWADETVTLHLGDCLDVLRTMENASIDAIVTDPPYGLEFMGKEWDTFSDQPGYVERARITTRPDAQVPYGRGGGVNSYQAGTPFQKWCQQWAAECLRVLKPGGHLLAFGGTRTWHRLTCGIEDAGFETRDSTADLTGIDGPGLLWLYGSGFPKSLNAARAIDRAMTPGEISPPVSAEGMPWEGWGTALKPSWEPIVVARKPLAGTVAANVLQHGTGALNVDGCRIHTPGSEGKPYTVKRLKPGATLEKTGGNWRPDNDEALPWEPGREYQGETKDGRWPPNVVLGSAAAEELDRQSGTLTSGANPARNGSDKFRDAYGDFAGQEKCTPHRGANSGGASRFFPVFRYEAKAGASERPRLEDGTAHPTVKPVDLMAWLVRLVTPPGGLVLDPFAGSGTTAEACIVEGFRCVLIEQDPKSAELIRKRLSKPIQPVMFGFDEAS